MKEGTVVMVVGKQDTRVREAKSEVPRGTVWFSFQKEVVVLLTDGNLWKGPLHEVCHEQEDGSESAQSPG